jgi:hypothetical protein
MGPDGGVDFHRAQMALLVWRCDGHIEYASSCGQSHVQGQHGSASLKRRGHRIEGGRGAVDAAFAADDELVDAGLCSTNACNKGCRSGACHGRASDEDDSGDREPKCRSAECNDRSPAPQERGSEGGAAGGGNDGNGCVNR